MIRGFAEGWLNGMVGGGAYALTSEYLEVHTTEWWCVVIPLAFFNIILLNQMISK